MENASKALIIAGTTLLSIIVLGIIVFLVDKLSVVSETYTSKLDTVELQKYNKNFEVYIDRVDITAQEIVTLVSLSQEKNNVTTVFLGNQDCTNIWDEDKKNDFLKDYFSKEFEYSSITYNTDGKVMDIHFITK